MTRPVFTTLTLPASSLEEAHAMIGRLANAGFARNSMAVEREDDAFEVTLHCREANRARAQQVAAGGGFAFGSPGALAALGLIALATGAGILVALTAKRAFQAEKQPASDGWEKAKAA